MLTQSVSVIECLCNVIFASSNQSCKTTRVAKTLWVEEEAEDKVTVFELKLCLERAPLFSLSLSLSLSVFVSVCCSTRESCALKETVCWVCSHHSCCIEINRKRERDTLLLQKLHLCLLLSALEKKRKKRKKIHCLLGWVSSSPSLLLLLLLLLHEINRKSVTLLQKLLLCLYVCVCVPALERERDEEKPLFVGWVSSSPLLLLHEINRRVLSCCKSSSSVCVSVCV